MVTINKGTKEWANLICGGNMAQWFRCWTWYAGDLEFKYRSNQYAFWANNLQA